MKTIKQLTAEAHALKIKYDERALDISHTVGTNEEYQKLEEMIQNARKRQEEIKGNNEYQKDYENALSELREALESQGIREAEGVKLKTRDTKKVNVLAVRATLDDEDQFMSLIEIKQKTLGDFIKAVPELKKPLQSCIEVVSSEVVGIELI